MRLLYSVLMTLSTAIFVFVLTPDESMKYKSALAELAALSQLNGPNYYAFVHKRLQDSEDREGSRILNIARKAGLSVPKPVRYPLPAVSDRPPDNKDLFQCDAFFRGTQSLAPILLDSTDDALVERLRNEALHQGVTVERLVAVRLVEPSGAAEAGGGIMLSPDGLASTQWRGVINFLFEGNSVTMAPKNVQIVTVLVRGPVYSGALGLEWLRQDQSGRDLVDPRTGIVFPHLKPFWNQFGTSMRTDTVTEYLQQQLQSLKGGTVSFFGISVNGALMVAVAPVLCFVTFLYFQLIFARFVASSSLEDESVKEFPWVPLFPGRLARTVTYGSFCFPLVVNVWLVAKYGVWNEGRTWIGFAGFVLLFAVALGAIFSLSHFHTRMRVAGER